MSRLEKQIPTGFQRRVFRVQSKLVAFRGLYASFMQSCRARRVSEKAARYARRSWRMAFGAFVFTPRHSWLQPREISAPPSQREHCPAASRRRRSPTADTPPPQMFAGAAHGDACRLSPSV